MYIFIVKLCVKGLFIHSCHDLRSTLRTQYVHLIAFVKSSLNVFTVIYLFNVVNAWGGGGGGVNLKPCDLFINRLIILI